MALISRLGRRSLQQSLSGQFTRSSSTLIIDPKDHNETKILTDVIEDLSMSVIGGPTTYDPQEYDRRRQELVKYVPASQDELPHRRMSDSFDSALIPLGSDKRIRDRYATHLGGVRIGRLLEDMDIFAVHLVFKHTLLPMIPEHIKQSPFSIVTALVDRIFLHGKLNFDQDIKMSGHVTWVGRSSAESTLVLEQQRDNGTWERVTEASFVLVARDPLNTKGAVLNPLKVETDAEKELFQIGHNNMLKRKETAKDSLFKHPPSEHEKEIIHDFFIQTVDHSALSFKSRIKPEKSVWMEDAKLKNLVVCQPENRNRFNKIFGGFIMRQAFELAWGNAYIFCRERPYTVYMDDISFEAPVEVGNLLYFNSQISFVHQHYIQVRVSAEVLDPKTGSLKVTNVFHYTFELRGGMPRSIIPKTYHEAMMYLNSRRHFLNSLQQPSA